LGYYVGLQLFGILAIAVLIISIRYLYIARRQKNTTGITPKYYGLFILLLIVSALIIIINLIVIGLAAYFWVTFT
jgi:hypothetical protein